MATKKKPPDKHRELMEPWQVIIGDLLRVDDALVTVAGRSETRTDHGIDITLAMVDTDGNQSTRQFRPGEQLEIVRRCGDIEGDRAVERIREEAATDE